MVQFTEEVILPQKILESLKINISGSVVMHIGIVHPSSEGKKVVSIEYQAERSEGEGELFLIAAEVRAKWQIQDIGLYRRMGKLNLGDAILVAAVAAPHRREAFEACMEAVERMRNMVSVKKEEIVA